MFVILHIYRIDAEEEDDSYGRLLNDEHKWPNCRPKVLEVDKRPHLCFFALTDLNINDELLYDYGDMGNFPWREVRYWHISALYMSFVDIHVCTVIT